MFGQQTRIRNGLMMPDERLPHFYARHDLVTFFYSAIRTRPPYLVDAPLEASADLFADQQCGPMRDTRQRLVTEISAGRPVTSVAYR